MGVGRDLAGRSVRCPHCKQVAKAPAASDPAAAAASPPSGPTPAPPIPTVPVPSFVSVYPPESESAPTVLPSPALAPDPGRESDAAPEFQVPEFSSAPREARESILGDPEESEDEVFTSGMGNRFELPKPAEFGPPPVHHVVSDTDATVVSRRPGGDTQRTPAPEPPPAPANPFGGFEDASDFEPVADPTVQENAWTASDAATTPPPLELAEADDLTQDGVTIPTPPPPVRKPAFEPRKAPAPTPPTSRGGRWLKVGFVGLLVYALAMTGLAVYGLFPHTPKIDPGHPLSNIPDTIGEFPSATRTKVGSLGFPLDGPLPAELKVSLNGKLRVGDLLVEPLAVQRKKLTIYQQINEGKDLNKIVEREPSYLLKLRLTNLSSDVSFYPADPAFNRAYKRDEKLPGTGLVVPSKTFYGALPWPRKAGGAITAQYVEGQEHDKEPLGPGQTRETVVVTFHDGRILDLIKATDAVLTWRVQLRHGLFNLNGRDVPVSAIVGVEFKPKEIETVLD